MVAALLCDGALPDLSTAQVRDGDSGWVEELAIDPRGWRAGASARDAAEALDAHLEPVIAALSARRAARALWREASDRVGQAVLWCGEAFGRRREAWALGTLLLASPTRLRAHAEFELRDGVPFRRRGGCCLPTAARGA